MLASRGDEQGQTNVGIAGQQRVGVNTTTIYEERFMYTGKISVQWRPIDWDDPSLKKNFSFDFMSLIPNVASKLPGVEMKVEAVTQWGEILHEARVDRQYYGLTIINNVPTSLTAKEYVEGNFFRWVSSPFGKDYVPRTQINSCFVTLCSEWRGP